MIRAEDRRMHEIDELDHARVLIHVGELSRAEHEIARHLDSHPENPRALELFAKLKHMRGQLSETVALWTQLQAAADGASSGHLHLVSMFELARDPERGAGAFVSLGHLQLVRKPAAYLALEEAFRLHLARQPVAARQHCAMVARRHHGSDREIFKLAVLAEAWICELSGETEAACALLERLGAERGFEHDVDRVTALASLYERQQQPERLRAAINIYQYLASACGDHPGGACPPPAELLGRLARLYRRVEDPGAAERCAQRQLELFRCWMQWPSAEELVAVAARAYVPLRRICQAAVEGPPRLPEESSPRVCALARVVEGDRVEARSLLAAGAEPLDRCYLADLAELEGRPLDAARGYLSLVREDPGRREAVWRLLDLAGAGSLPGFRKLLADREIRARIGELLEEDALWNPGDPRSWRRLAAFHGATADEEGKAARYTGRAEAIERAAGPAIGRVLSAALYRVAGVTRGMIHEVWAGRQPCEPGAGGALPDERLLGNLGPDMADSVRNVFAGVREYAKSRFPGRTARIADYIYEYKVTKEDEQSHGASAGLPTALAFLSVMLQEPVPQDVAATGVVTADAHDVLTLHPVGGTDHKVVAACLRNLRRIVVPEGNRAELEASPRVPGGVRERIVAYAADLDQAVRLVFGPRVFL